MAGINETIKTVNSTVRTFLTLVFVGGAGYAGYLGYALYHEPQAKLEQQQAALDQALGELEASQEANAQLSTQLQEKSEQVARLDLAMRLLKIRKRLARLTTLDQQTDPDSEILTTRVEFVEINEEGQPIGEPKEFSLEGDMAYVDYLRVTFDDQYIEQSDFDRSTAICIFQRIFGEHQEPVDGFTLDQVGTRPTAYARGSDMSDFEQKIWDQFWLIANDTERASELGIHAAHGAAVSMRLQPGASYEIELRATGNISIRPVTAAESE